MDEAARIEQRQEMQSFVSTARSLEKIRAAP
jgi:hypothetical protein